MSEQAIKQRPESLLRRIFSCIFRLLYFAFLALLIIPELLYLALLSLLTIPTLQRQAVFQHGLKLPLFANFDKPEKYGLAPGKVANVHFTTLDNCVLAAWFILADPFFQGLRASPTERGTPPTETVIRNAIKAHPTILFLHGSGGSRAISWDIAAYASFTSRLHANVFAFDYRGFADSTGVPSSDGLTLDAYEAWKWLVERGAKPGDIVLVGHSLGTGVAAQLVRRLAAEGVAPRGVALLAPFSRYGQLVEASAIMWPVRHLPWGIRLLRRCMRHEFDTLGAIGDFRAPTLLAHCRFDANVSHTHSRTLFNAMLEPLLPAVATKTTNSQDATAEERNARRREIVRTTDIPNFGVIEEFAGLHAPVVYVETLWGAHCWIGSQEGVQDEMAKLFHLGWHRHQT
ncbi:alpha/beta hydrolase [Phanerochaete sordida]|uniref:Alpha/beta hydrolase n=1 Tax=Phanerochaete sordida TaxID=48140 RepID=A0A9P3G5B1_9APHY|nr:alpha/beta hydrolase [Phanerochaete sordida]